MRGLDQELGIWSQRLRDVYALRAHEEPGSGLGLGVQGLRFGVSSPGNHSSQAARQVTRVPPHREDIVLLTCFPSSQPTMSSASFCRHLWKDTGWDLSATPAFRLSWGSEPSKGDTFIIVTRQKGDPLLKPCNGLGVFRFWALASRAYLSLQIPRTLLGQEAGRHSGASLECWDLWAAWLLPRKGPMICLTRYKACRKHKGREGDIQQRSIAGALWHPWGSWSDSGLTASCGSRAVLA